jgi:ubiquinone/menaquinone biosynthesis C-methylase UbiE
VSNSQETPHKDRVRHEFTKQAENYAAASLISDPERVARLVRAVDPAPGSRVLEVATGPGYVAMGFAAVCREVMGIDLTEAPLAIAERIRQERGLDNVRFQTGDAERLAFANGEFDVAVCRFAFHHFEEPPKVLREMARVCRTGGTVAVEDLIVSEHPERAAYHNRFENLRDTSHTRAFPLSALLRIFAETGLEVEHVSTSKFPQHVERWLSNAKTPPDRAAETRALIKRDVQEDLSGTSPFTKDGSLYFVHHIATVVGRKLR